VVAVLHSDFLTQGPALPSFEKAVADYYVAQHAVAVNSATSALPIDCLVVRLSQMQRLDDFVTKRHAIGKCYDQLLSALPALTQIMSA
jgi:dTDP-4-amino-4,6-dideoxygalactose transaminase